MKKLLLGLAFVMLLSGCDININNSAQLEDGTDQVETSSINISNLEGTTWECTVYKVNEYKINNLIVDFKSSNTFSQTYMKEGVFISEEYSYSVNNNEILATLTSYSQNFGSIPIPYPIGAEISFDFIIINNNKLKLVNKKLNTNIELKLKDISEDILKLELLGKWEGALDNDILILEITDDSFKMLRLDSNGHLVTELTDTYKAVYDNGLQEKQIIYNGYTYSFLRKDNNLITTCKGVQVTYRKIN